MSSLSPTPYYHKVMAAPMVRVSTLAFRLVCAHHTADVVFTEELVAAKLMKCMRRYLPPTTDTLFPSSPDDNEAKSDVKSRNAPSEFVPVLNMAFGPSSSSSPSLSASTTTTTNNDDSPSSSCAQEGGDSDKTKKAARISRVLKRWCALLPFLEPAILAGRVEVLYRGHAGEQSKKKQGEDDDDDGAKGGEIVFTTLAMMRVHSTANNDVFAVDNISLLLPRHNIPNLVFTRTEGTATLIGQIGASDPNVAVAAFRLLAPFIAGMDVNMGCPKAFSVKNGMGAALMANKEKGAAILGALSAAFPSLPISYKTRLFENLKDNVEHLGACFRATNGKLHALTVHSRHRPQRSEKAPLYDDAVELAKMIRAEELFLRNKTTSSDGSKQQQELCLIFNGSMALRPYSAQQQQQPVAAPSSSSSSSSSPAAAADDDDSATTKNTAAAERKEIDVLVSGECAGKQKMLEKATALGFDGSLVARGSMWKPSVFLSPEEYPKRMPCLSDSAVFCRDTTNQQKQQPQEQKEEQDSVFKLVLREFQCLTVAYAACGDNVRLLKYHLTRAIPEYQHLCHHDNHHHHTSDDRLRYNYHESQAKLKTLFEAIQGTKTLPEFAKALQFTEEEVEALMWMDALVSWRRGHTAVPEQMPQSSPSTAGDDAAGAGDTAPCRREREGEVSV